MVTRKQAKEIIQQKFKGGEEELEKRVLTLIATRKEDEASEEIVKEILKNNYIYSTKDDLKSEMWIYLGGIYIPNGESEIKRICRELLGETYTTQRANRVIEKIRADTYIETGKFFELANNKEEIPVLNGILNIKTKELSDFNPKKVFFSKLQVHYNKEKKCPAIEKFFKDILKDETDVKVMYELIGYCLLKDYPIERAFMFVGDGRNGKGKTLLLIKKFLGIDNVCSVPLTQMKHDSSALCELHNRLANLSGDLNNTSIKETGVLKQITGRDLIQARRKFLRDIAFINYSKQIFACNELPRVFDNSKGWWSRWILLEFPYEFVTQEDFDKRENKQNLKVADVSIIDKISTPDEHSGLLNKALEGLRGIAEKQDFSITKGTAEIKDIWIRKSDSFMAFCLDHIEEDHNGWIEKKELRKKFSKYCRKHKIKGASDKDIKITLESMYGAVSGDKQIRNEFRNEEKMTYDYVKLYVWEGIKFKELNLEGEK